MFVMTSLFLDPTSNLCGAVFVLAFIFFFFYLFCISLNFPAFTNFLQAPHKRDDVQFSVSKLELDKF